MQQAIKAVKENNIVLLFLAITLAVTIIRIGILTAHIWPVNGDETQYWSWAKHLAWGYYSKPPMVAWLIALSTNLFGNGIAAIRLAAPLTHSITAIMIYLIAQNLYADKFVGTRRNQSEKIAFWAGLIYLLAPGATFSSTIISTDPPLLMFWSMAFYCFIRAIQPVETRFIAASVDTERPVLPKLVWWGGMGITLGLAMLSKYAALFLVVSMLCYFLIEKKQRCNLFKPGLYLALLIAILILLPNIVWNSHHAFVSVAAVKDNADLQGQNFKPMHLLNFFAAQFAVINPIIFAFLLIFICQIKVWRDAKARLLLAFIIPVFAVMLFEALLVRAHSNWAAPMYIAAAILVSAELIKRNKKYLLIIALLLNLVVIIGFINVQTLARMSHINIHRPTTIVNWREAAKNIIDLRKQYPQANLLADDRMLLTEIMYFGRFDLVNTFKWNPKHQLHGQYDLVTHLDTEKGKNFLLFTYNKTPLALMQRFNQSKLLEPLELEALDGRTLHVYIFYLTGFKGYA